MRLRVRGQGLPEARVYVRRNEKQRWRSPAISISPQWTEHEIALAQFDYQERPKKGAKWERKASQPFGRTEMVQIKVGYFVNEVEDRGTLWVDDLRFD